MQDIFSHIAYLLTNHECVIIPGFGALVHSAMSAPNAMDQDVFSPPRVSLGFNSELKHNDGLLCDSVKREKNVSYNDANKIISDFSAGLIDLLNKKKEFTIPHVGHFIQTKEKKINFSPASDLSANAGQYGFKNFYLPLLSEIIIPEEKEETEKIKGRNVVMIPLSKRLLTASSVAATALLFLLFSTPIDNREIPAQYAGMFSSYTRSIPEVVPVDLQEEQPVENIKKTDAIVLSQDKKSDLEEKKIDSFSNKYYIIIASFLSRNTAEKELSYFKKEFDSASIIEKPNRSRIYIRSFQDKKEAEQFLYKFRTENPKHKDAWLFCNKAES